MKEFFIQDNLNKMLEEINYLDLKNLRHDVIFNSLNGF